MLAFKVDLLLLLAYCASGAQYVPGTPGGPWSQQELFAVKSKLLSLFRYVKAPVTLRLSFHDCVKYEDGTGGCDGCLNWDGVDVRHYPVMFEKNFTNLDHGNNNGLGNIVRELEKIYTIKNYPWDSQELGMSLFESGKSRADLWSYAAIVAVEYGYESNNMACVDVNDPRLIGHSCTHNPNTTECFVRPTRPIQFQWGRADCTEFDPEFPYKATKKEHHPSPVADGRATVEYFKKDFGFTGRDTAAIFGAHSYGFLKVQNSLFPYTWTSSQVNALNNAYYKNLVGRDMWVIDDASNQCRLTGDAYGKKPRTRWLAHTRKFTERGGPIFWIHQNHACPPVYNDMFWNDRDRQCIADAGPGQMCRPDPAQKNSNVPRTPDQPDARPSRGCERWQLIIGKDEIALNCEMGLYLDFKVTDGIIHGCPGLEHFNASMASDAKGAVWSRMPGKRWLGEPGCPKQMLAEPAGSTPLYKIMEEYADDQTKWIDDFTIAFEKMMRNGYPQGLNDGPDLHPKNLECPLPALRTRYYAECYALDEPSNNGEMFMIGNMMRELEGKVYQYNKETGIFDFAAPTGEANQQWMMSSSGKQLINVFTGKALTVSGQSEFRFDGHNNDTEFFGVSTLNGKVLDCWAARNPNNACIVYPKHGGGNQRFFKIPVEFPTF